MELVGEKSGTTLLFLTSSMWCSSRLRLSSHKPRIDAYVLSVTLSFLQDSKHRMPELLLKPGEGLEYQEVLGKKIHRLVC